jgi:hypothetical protein
MYTKSSHVGTGGNLSTYRLIKATINVVILLNFIEPLVNDIQIK